jgi:N-acetylneuraminic acid mutarotase
MQYGSRGFAIAAFCVGACLGGCGDGGGGGGAPATPPPAAPLTPPTPAPVHVEGAVQKGPFLVGSTVLINRRDERGLSTSSTILSEIEDSIGSFDFVTTDPGLVQIVANGYYFSELTGQVSNGTLTLRALYGITSQPGQKAYVNIMTHLINDRVLALLAAGNMDPAGAIAKAEAELVAAFRDALPVANVEGFSGLSVYNTSATGAAVGNTYLLALSTGFYEYAAMKAEEFGTATDAELTLALNRISDDLAADGDLDTAGFVRDFTTAIRSLSPQVISENLRRRAIVDYPAGLDVPDISVFLNLCAGNFVCPWSGAAPMPKGAERHATAAHGGTVYMFGGVTLRDYWCHGSFGFPADTFRDVFAYDRLTNEWERRASLPIGVCDVDAHTIGDKIYVVPRFSVRLNTGSGSITGTRESNVSNEILEYDPAADGWTRKTPRPSFRHAFVTATVSGKIYVVGGAGLADNGPWPMNSGGGPIVQEPKSLVEIYDPATDSWSMGHSAPIRLADTVSCAVGNQVYVFGSNAAAYWDPSVFVYDTGADQWSVKAPMSTRIQRRPCVTMGDKIRFFGGLHSPVANQAPTITDRVDVYDPFIDSWSLETRMPTARFNSSAARLGSEVLIFGGIQSGSYYAGYLDVVEVLNVDLLEDEDVP